MLEHLRAEDEVVRGVGDGKRLDGALEVRGRVLEIDADVLFRVRLEVREIRLDPRAHVEHAVAAEVGARALCLRLEPGRERRTDVVGDPALPRVAVLLAGGLSRGQERLLRRP